MLSPPLTGVFDVGGSGQVSSPVYEGDQPRGGASEGSLDSMTSPRKKMSRARFLCTWKNCQYRRCDTDETK